MTRTGVHSLLSSSFASRAARAARRRFRQTAVRVDRYWYNTRYASLGDEFVSEAWDNLLILDAARPDFLTSFELPSDVEIHEKYSPGSFSLGFMREQFFGRELHDTVYVTANPHVHDIPDGVFYDVIDLLDAHWDETQQTVLPERVAQAALEAFDDYPDKRLIVHFMQPHFPFVGPTGNEIMSGIPKHVEDNDQFRHPWFEQMWEGTYDRETLLTAYRENHEIVFSIAHRLATDLPGRTVITADHANLVGERGFPIPIRLYGHPRDFKHPALLRVPWIELDGEPRVVTEDQPVRRETAEDKLVRDRLNALGYSETSE